jgi:plasmid stabilization system protein ParE
MFGLVVRAAAAADIEDAYRWYQAARPGLGDEFLSAVRTTVDRILEAPGQYPVIHRHTRRALVRRFPYSLLYRVEAQHVLIVACFHAKRDPLVWQSRG